jgi:REP element-mobilizing transposase RayT
MTDILRSIIENPSEEISGKQALEQSLQFRVKPTPRPDRVYPQVQMGWRPEQERQVAQDEETAVPEETNRTSSEGNPTESGSRKRYLTFGAPIGHSSIQGDPLKDPEAALENAPWQPIDEGWVPGSEQPSAQPEESNGQANPFSPTFSAMSDTAETGGDLVSLLHEGLQQKKGMDVIDDEEPAVRDFVLEENEHYRKSPDEKDPLESDQTSDDQWDEQVSDITFYLVPRFDEHHLIGELSQQLKSWMRIICMKYGWELILLSVRPDYLKWTLGDFPESLIQEMLRLMRMETSKRIFRTFSDLQNENQGGDYWAPGYLVDLQNREFTTQALMAHVDSSRLNTRKEKTK